MSSDVSIDDPNGGRTSGRRVDTAPPVASAAEAGEEQRRWVGDEIRNLRRARDMTLAQLAEATGRSVGYLSQLERGQSEASIGVLQRVAHALGVQISWFFPENGPERVAERSVVVRHANRRRLSFASGITDFLLSPNLAGDLELLHSTMGPNADSGEAYTHRGEEAGVVLRGVLELWVDGERFMLEAGDSFSFKSHLPHRYRNPSGEVTEVIWVLTPPTY